MATQLVHVEIPAKDTARARTFYGELLGWSLDCLHEIDPHLVRDTTPQAALSPGDGADPTIYFGVEDLDPGLAAVSTLGGSREQPQEIPGVGRYAACRDDQGTAFSLYRPAASQDA